MKVGDDMNESIIKEKSCGAICYKIIDNKIYYLLIKQNKGHVTFPKGHVENNENEIDTALREIKEETNAVVEIDTNFREVSTYSPKNNVVKDVIFFVAKIIEDNFNPQDEEVREVYLKSYDEAQKLLTYNRDKEILNDANIYIIKKIIK